MRATVLCVLTFLSLGSEVAAQEVRHLRPELRLGSIDDPQYAFGRIGGVVVSTDGTIFVLDQMNVGVSVYAPNGEYIRSLGRRGSGPGEFLHPSDIGRIGDSIWVADQQNELIAYFSTTGELLGTRRLAFDPLSPFHGRTVPQALLRSGLAIVAPYGVNAGGGKPDPGLKTSVVWLDADGKAIGTLLERPRSAGLLYLSTGGTAVFQPYSDFPLWDVDDAGSFVGVVYRDAAKESSEGVFRIRLREASGATVYDRKYSYSPVRVSSQLTDSLVKDFAMEIPPHARGANLEEDIRSGLYLPPFHPTVTNIAVGVDGNVFVRREDQGGPTVPWSIFDSGGDPVANFLAPTSLRIFHAMGDMIIGTETDDLDVQYLVRYRIAGVRREG